MLQIGGPQIIDGGGEQMILAGEVIINALFGQTRQLADLVQIDIADALARQHA